MENIETTGGAAVSAVQGASIENNSSVGEFPGAQPSFNNTAAPSANTVVSNWLDSLSPEYRGALSGKGFKSVDDLARSYSNLESTLGRRTENFTETDWDNMRKATNVIDGVPESADKYEIDIDEYTKENGEKVVNTLDDGGIAYAKALSHHLGLNNEKAQMLYDALNNVSIQNNQEIIKMVNESIAETEAEIEKSWGKDGIKSREPEIKAALESVVPEYSEASTEWWVKFLGEAEVSGGLKAPVIKLIANLGKSVINARNSGYGAPSPAPSASEQLEFMSRDAEMSAILSKQSHPDHARVYKEYMALAAQVARERAGK